MMMIQGDQMNTPKLPPLPHWCEEGSPFAQQMQAYAIAAIEALRAQIGQGEPDGWQPIDTAPKDGTTILLATPKGRIAAGEWHQKYGVWSWPYVMAEPTHWRPSPKAPGASAPPAPQDKRCPLCKYQHGHQIGCENNPVDIALKDQAAHNIGEKK